MHVGIDIQPLQSGSKRHGIGRACREFLRTLFRSPGTHHYTLWASPSLPLDLPDEIPNHAVRRYRLDTSRLAPHDTLFPREERIRLDLTLEDQMISEGIELFHVLSPFEFDVFIPVHLPRIQTVFTVHDLIPYIFHEEYLDHTLATVRSNYHIVCDALKDVTRLIAISCRTKSDLTEHLGIPPERIDIAYWGAEHAMAGANKPMLHATSRQNILGLGSYGWNKNTRGLIESYALLSEAIRSRHPLVLFGYMKPEHQSRFELLARELQIHTTTRIANYVPDEELQTLYRTARMFVFPSFYEGFGFPVIEAMAFGTPVVVSQNSSLSELAGDAGIFCDPRNPRDIADKMQAVLSGTAEDGSAAELRIRQARKFTWDRCVSQIKQVYDTMEARRPALAPTR